MAGSPLSFQVIEYLDRIKRQPALASDPALVEDLLQAAREDMGDTYVSLATPKADDTWEGTCVFPGASAQSPSSSVDFQQPVRIVGMFPTIVALVPPLASPIPTLDDLLISVTVDKQDCYTSQQSQAAATTGSGASQFVTASALSILIPRLWDIKIESSNPKIEFVWAWKQGPNIFQDCICNVALLLQWRDQATGRWGLGSRRSQRQLR